MQTSTRPRFRQDLLAEVIEEGGQKFIDVADPDGRAMFRFFEVEYAIACGMDGQRDVAGIVKWAQDELGLSASAKEIQSVIDTLSGLAFIGDDQLVDQAATKTATQAPTPAPAQATTPAPAPAAAQAKAPAPAAKNDDLAKGVVVGKQGKTPVGGIDVELGQAGSSAPAAQPDKTPVSDFALGAPGASQAKTPPKVPVEDVALGAPGATAAPAKKADDVSLDLSSEMSVKAGDVKEAVRQSKVMTAVEVPKELLDAEAATKPATPAAQAKDDGQKSGKGKKDKNDKGRKSEPKIEAKPEPTPAPVAAKKDEPKVEAKPEPVPAKKDEPKVEAKPEPAPVAVKKDEPKKDEPKKTDEPKKAAAVKTPEKQPVAPPAPSSGPNTTLIVLVIVLVVAVGAFLAYRFVFAKEEAPPKPAPTAQTPPPPPAPTTAQAKVVLDTPAAVEVKAGVAGALESIEPAGKDVKAGDTIAVLAGAKPLTTEIENLTKQIAALQAPVDAQQKVLETEQGKENNAAGAEAAQKKLDALKKPVADKETQLKAKQEQLDKLAIKSTGDGKLAATAEVALKAGDKITAEQVIAKIERPTVPTAQFKIPAGAKVGADGTISVKVEGGATVTCKVTDAQAESLKVACPSDAGLADGAALTVEFPAT